jgi:hypothetical protein
MHHHSPGHFRRNRLRLRRLAILLKPFQKRARRNRGFAINTVKVKTPPHGFAARDLVIRLHGMISAASAGGSPEG